MKYNFISFGDCTWFSSKEQTMATRDEDGMFWLKSKKPREMAEIREAIAELGYAICAEDYPNGCIEAEEYVENTSEILGDNTYSYGVSVEWDLLGALGVEVAQ